MDIYQFHIYKEEDNDILDLWCWSDHWYLQQRHMKLDLWKYIQWETASG